MIHLTIDKLNKIMEDQYQRGLEAGKAELARVKEERDDFAEAEDLWKQLAKERLVRLERARARIAELEAQVEGRGE